MKKFFIVALAATLCVALTVPAMAKVSIYGWITNDLAYEMQDSENLTAPALPGQTNLQDDLDRVMFSSPRTSNRLGVRYSNDDGSVIGRIELRGGTTTGTNDNDLHWNYAYVMWRLNPMFRIQVGRQAQTFAIAAPGSSLNWQNTKTALLVGFGNVHGGSSRDGIKALIKFTDQVRAEIQLLDPDNDTELAIPRDATAGPGGFSPEENVIPRVDASVNIKVANVVIEPSVTWARQEYDQVAAGNDDSLDAWGLCLFAQAGFGPITVAGEVTYGENLGDSNYNIGGGAPGGSRIYADANGFTRIEDTETLAFWVKGAYNFGPATLSVAYGMQNMENDGNPAVSRDAQEIDVSRQSIAVWLDIQAAKGFTVSPTVIWQDYDDSATWGPTSTTQDVDFGTETIIGVEFSLKF